MSRFRVFLIGMMVGLGLGLVAVVLCVRIEDAPTLHGAGRADPSPGPPAPWPAYDSGPMHPGENLYQLITEDGKGVHSRSIDFLPKLLAHDPGPPKSFPAPDHK